MIEYGERPPGGPPLTRREAREREARTAAGTGAVAVQPAPVGAADLDEGTGESTGITWPAWVEEAVERRRAVWTPVDSRAALLTGAHLVGLLAVLGPGSFWTDDLRAQGYALDQPFWSFIMGSNGTHFAPLPRVLDWVQSRAFPLEHGPAVVVTLVVRLLLAVAFWRLLRRIFGPRQVVLLPFLVLLVTPALLPATTWYRQSITVLACTVAIVWALDAFVAWMLERRPLSLVVVGVATAAAVGCYEKGAAVPVILVAAYLALFAGSRGTLPAARGRLRAASVAIGLSGVLVLGFLAIYRAGPYDQGTGSPPGVGEVLLLAWDTSTRTILPMLLGLPWTWFPDGPYTSGFHPQAWAVAVVGLIWLAGLVAALRRGPANVARGAVLLLAALLPSVTIVAVGRLDDAGDLLADTGRLWADLVPFFLLAATVAALGLPTGRRPSAPRTTRALMAVAGVVVLGSVVLGSVVSTATYVDDWWKNPTGDWISNAREGLAGAGADPRLLATPLPDTVMPSWVSTEFPSSAPLLLLMEPGIRFHDGDGPTLAVGASGDLVAPGQYELGRNRGTPSCAARMPAARETSPWIRLDRDTLYLPGAQVEVGLLTGGAGKVRVEVRTPDGTELTPQRFSDAVLDAGAHTVRVPVPLGKSVRYVRVGVGDSADTCVTQVRVWSPVG